MIEYQIETGSAAPEGDEAMAAAIAIAYTRFAALPLAQIAPSLTNPRKHFNPERLAELAQSIAASGVHQPILVRPLPGHRTADTGRKITHEIVSGERRYRASQMADQATIPAMIRQLADAQVLEIQLIENLQRDDLTELEEAEGYKQLCDATGIKKEDIGAKIGKSRRYVYDRIRLLGLTQAAKEALRDGQIDASRALAIAQVPDAGLQQKCLDEALEKDYNGETPFLSVRELKTWIRREFMLDLGKARFDITDITLLPAAGSCKTCPKRTGHDPDLFADIAGADVCTDSPCFHEKEAAQVAREIEQAAKNGQTIITGKEARELMPSQFCGVADHLRLDDARDAPGTGKVTLRTLLKKQLAAQPEAITLLANPHQAGDYIAVLQKAVAMQMLKDAGLSDKAKAVKADTQAAKKRDAAIDSAELKNAYEKQWRKDVMAATYSAIADASDERFLSPAITRTIAEKYIHDLQTDRAKSLCKILDLGKVAPKDALLAHIQATPRPTDTLLLLVMEADSEFHNWLPEGSNTNIGLMQVAKNFNVKIDAIKSEAKLKLMPEPAELPSQKRPAALRLPDASTAKAKAPKPAKPKKMSEQEAISGIAEAMQGIEAASPQQGASAVVVGSKVKVTSEKDEVGPIAGSYADKEGVVTLIETINGVETCNVKFKRGAAVFAIGQLEVLA